MEMTRHAKIRHSREARQID